MSLASLNFATAANEGRVLTVLHPIERTTLLGADGKPVTITLLGKDSDAFVAAENAARNRAVEQVTSGAKFSAAASDEEAASSLARATTGWSGVVQGWIDGTDDETPAKFSVENARKLYLNRGVKWLRDQADRFVGDRANFLPASPTN
jgi:hypothetical protein